MKQIKTDVLILIEHVARELETANQLMNLFAERGKKVIIDSIKFNKELKVIKYRADIIIVPWAYSNKEMNLFNNFKRFGEKCIILNMHNEQLSNEGSYNFILPEGNAVDTFHVSWGKDFTNRLLKIGVKKDKILEVGNPKLDFYHNLADDKSKIKHNLSLKYELSESKKWVLYIANSFHLLSDKQIKINETKGVDIKSQIESGTKNRKIFLTFIEEYLQNNDDIEIIYRGHPSFSHLENEDTDLIRIKAKSSKFHCISNESINSWITCSDICYSFHSTAYFECIMSNTPFYLTRIEPLDQNSDYPFFKDYKHTIHSINELKDSMTEHRAAKENFYRDIEICDYIKINTEKSACEQIVEKLLFIESKYNNGNNVDTRKLVFNFEKTRIIAILKLFASKILKINFLKTIARNSKDIRIFNLLDEGNDYFETIVSEPKSHIK